MTSHEKQGQKRILQDGRSGQPVDDPWTSRIEILGEGSANAGHGKEMAMMPRSCGQVRGHSPGRYDHRLDAHLPTESTTGTRIGDSQVWMPAAQWPQDFYDEKYRAEKQGR